MKADVQNVSGELIVSGLDSATSLIQAAKNLMNAVVLTVKSCYVASTKYPRLAAEGKLNQLKPVVVWKMKVSLFFKILLDGRKWYFVMHSRHYTVGVINFFQLHGHPPEVDAWVRLASAEIFSPIGPRQRCAAKS